MNALFESQENLLRAVSFVLNQFLIEKTGTEGINFRFTDGKMSFRLAGFELSSTQNFEL